MHGSSQKAASESTQARFGLANAPSDSVIEDRIAHIRTVLLPHFTADPLLAADPEPDPPAPAPQPVSRLRQPSSRAQISSSRGATAATSSAPLGKQRAASGAKQVRVADAPGVARVPSSSGPGKGGASKTATMARRLSRRASAARTRRSTTFGRGYDAAILRVSTLILSGRLFLNQCFIAFIDRSSRTGPLRLGG